MSGEVTSSPFKMIVFFTFFGFAALGVVMFAMFKGSATDNNYGEVSMWGTIPEEQFNSFLTQYTPINDSVQTLQYTYIESEAFDNSLVEALASGYGPDLVLLSNEQIMRHRDRMFVTPYDENYSTRDFKDKFAEVTESLLLPEGVIGMPVAIDPLVLYWNRTLLSINQYPLPPSEWSQLFKMSQKITKKSEAGNIELSAIALGEVSNVLHAKDIFIAMLTQAGGSILRTNNDGLQVATLTSKNSSGTTPAQDALRFFTEFSNPVKSTYTWSKAQPLDRDAFTRGELAMYIGYASELPLILDQNPNLNFDVARLPYLTNGNGENFTTFARVYALAIPVVSSNPHGASYMLDTLTTEVASDIFSNNIGLPSPHKSLLADEPTDSLKTTFRNSALVARSWLDPNPSQTSAIINKMIESVVSGRQRMSQAIERAQQELQVLLGNNY